MDEALWSEVVMQTWASNPWWFESTLVRFLLGKFHAVLSFKVVIGIIGLHHHLQELSWHFFGINHFIFMSFQFWNHTKRLPRFCQSFWMMVEVRWWTPLLPPVRTLRNIRPWDFQDGRVKGQEGLCACHGLHVDHVVHGTYLCGSFAFAQVTLENYVSTYIHIYPYISTI